MQMMIRYYFSTAMESFKQWWKAVQAARSMDRLLRDNGFTEISPGRWEKPL
jgi:hypothetical protein